MSWLARHKETNEKVEHYIAGHGLGEKIGRAKNQSDSRILIN